MTQEIRRDARRGFTLIELLIVVAIIAILAAIAVPNFLEAQTRAKVSRARSDMRTTATALEAYRVDNNNYPPTPFSAGGTSILRVVPSRLTSPIAYMTSVMNDAFLDNKLQNFQAIAGNGNIVTYSWDSQFRDPEGNDPIAGRRYYYLCNRDPRRFPPIGSYTPAQQAAVQAQEGDWILASLGPNKRRELVTVPGTPEQVLLPYDATNGTVSEGDIVRSQKYSEGNIKP